MASVIATCDHSVPRTTPNIAPPTADRRMRGKPIDTRPVPATAKASQAHPRHWASHCCRCATLSDVLPWPQGVKVSSHVETMRKTASNNTRQTSLRTEGGAVPARDRCNGSCFTCLKDGLLHPAEPRDAGGAGRAGGGAGSPLCRIAGLAQFARLPADHRQSGRKL